MLYKLTNWYKLATRLIEICENECAAKSSVLYDARGVTRARRAADEARQRAVEQLRQVRYFYQQAHWLTERFPDAELRDVEGWLSWWIAPRLRLMTGV